MQRVEVRGSSLGDRYAGFAGPIHSKGHHKVDGGATVSGASPLEARPTRPCRRLSPGLQGQCAGLNKTLPNHGDFWYISFLGRLRDDPRYGSVARGPLR